MKKKQKTQATRSPFVQGALPRSLPPKLLVTLKAFSSGEQDQLGCLWLQISTNLRAGLLLTLSSDLHHE